MGSFGEKRKKNVFRFCRLILDIFGFPLLSIDRFQCHTIKNKEENIQWKKLRNFDIIEED